MVTLLLLYGIISCMFCYGLLNSPDYAKLNLLEKRIGIMLGILWPIFLIILIIMIFSGGMRKK